MVKAHEQAEPTTARWPPARWDQWEGEWPRAGTPQHLEPGTDLATFRLAAHPLCLQGHRLPSECDDIRTWRTLLLMGETSNPLNVSNKAGTIRGRSFIPDGEFGSKRKAIILLKSVNNRLEAEQTNVRSHLGR